MSVSDYKMEIQAIAEEMAEALYHRDFYDLPPDRQADLYNEAYEQYREAGMRKAERRIDAGT